MQVTPISIYGFLKVTADAPLDIICVQNVGVVERILERCTCEREKDYGG